MSIALSVCIKPSRILRHMVFAVCILGNAALVYIVQNARSLDQYSLVLLLACCLFSVIGLIKFFRKRFSVGLDISETGNVVLRMPGLRTGASCAIPVRLHQKSTFWPMLILLHLQSDEGGRMVFPVLPDCVDPDVFRRLFVSLRWISAHASSQYIEKNDVSSGNF